MRAGVQVIAPNGILTTLIAAGPRRITVDGVSTAFFPSAIAVGRAGILYVADFSPKLLVELSSTGQVLHSWPTYVTQAGLATAPDGSVLVADYGQFAVDRIAGNQLTSIATFGRNSLAGLTGTFRPSGIAVSRSGRLYVDTDRGERRNQPTDNRGDHLRRPCPGTGNGAGQEQLSTAPDSGADMDTPSFEIQGTRDTTWASLIMC
ncbi:MAG: NHL repeat-containing protein [Acidimicrobiales bacterium]